MDDNRNTSRTSFHIPRPNQSLFPLFMYWRDQWNLRKQQQQEEAQKLAEQGATGTSSSGGVGANSNQDNKGFYKLF